MLPKLLTSGEEAQVVETDGWVDLLVISGQDIVNWITIVNEGDWPGFWRITDDVNGGETPAIRLACGSGESGGRRAGVNIPCSGLSGATIQVKKGLMGGDLSGLFAFAGK